MREGGPVRETRRHFTWRVFFSWEAQTCVCDGWLRSRLTLGVLAEKEKSQKATSGEQRFGLQFRQGLRRASEKGESRHDLAQAGEGIVSF